MKFAIINDMHIGPLTGGFHNGVQRKLISQSEPLVKKFVQTMNDVEKPTFVVNLGDSIEDVNNKEVDIISFQKTIELLSPLQMPHYTLIGNHDIRTLSSAEIATMLGIERMYYSFDRENFHFIVLSFEMTGKHTVDVSDIRAEVTKEQIEWLKKDLEQTNKNCIVFTHYGVADDDMKGNFWFESQPHYGVFRNQLQLREIFEASKKVKAVISAHQHWNKMHIHSGIPYFVVTALVENFKNDGIASEAYTIVNLTEQKISLDVRGNDPVFFEFNFSPLK